jgi:hypothetical protein
MARGIRIGHPRIFALTTAQGGFTHTGQAVTLAAQRTLALANGPFIHAGQAVTFAVTGVSISAPRSLNATTFSDSQINLTWVAPLIGVATGYRLYRDGSLIATLGNVLSYSDTSLTAGTLYSYTARAVDGVGTVSVDSNTASATTQAGSGTGNTINAASASFAAVQAAVDSAVDGDTVLIPSGAATWTTALQVTKGITIQGAGIGSTVITDNVAKSGSGGSFSCFYFNVPAGKTWKLLRMTIVGQATDVSVNVPGHIRIDGNATFRIGYVRLSPMQTMGVRVLGGAVGVIDHCYFQTNGYQTSIEIEHSTWGGVGDYGDYSWSQPSALGTGDSIYIEDCQFVGVPLSSTLPNLFDALSGARYVFRRNTVNDMRMTSHGIETGSNERRALRKWEIYDNTFSIMTPAWTDYVCMQRGGTGLVFNNTMDVAGTNGFLKLVHFNSSAAENQPSAYFGATTGSNPWDQNAGAGGYRALDQVGAGRGNLIVRSPKTPAWPNQASEPVYCWNNARTGSGPYVNSGALIQANRDYYTEATSFNGTTGTGRGLLSARPATCTTGVAYFAIDTNTLYRATATNTWTAYYTPYIYPHPLVT